VLNQDLVVVYKEGEVGEGDDGQWGKLSSFTTEAKGLGGSQRGEVAWVNAQKMKFRKMDVAMFTSEIAEQMAEELCRICRDTEGAELLADVISTCEEAQRGLQSLCLLGADDAGVQALASVLPSLANLKYLDLRHGWIGDAGIQAIASALPKMRNLQILDLRGCCRSRQAPLRLSDLSALHPVRRDGLEIKSGWWQP